MKLQNITSFFNEVSQTAKEKFIDFSEKMGSTAMIQSGLGALPLSIGGYIAATGTNNPLIMMGTMALGAAITYPLLIGGTLQLERENKRVHERAMAAQAARMQAAPGHHI